MATNGPIYMDNNATTRVDNEVLAAMLPYFTRNYGNAASKTHPFGWRAEDAVEQAREQVAKLIGAEPGELIFTSGSTEAINLCLKGAFEMYAGKGNHIVTVCTEHKAVLDTCAALQRHGAQVTCLPVDSNGLINLDQLEMAITGQTILVSIMLANNETGVIQNMDAIADIVHAKGSLLMSDATQAVGKLPIDLQQQRIDLMPLSAHKFYGPKGVGALYLRRRDPRVRLVSQIDGGGHEKGLRSGTLNVPGIVGLGKAAELAVQNLDSYATHTLDLRQQLEVGLLSMGDTEITAEEVHRLPNTVNARFKGINSQKLVRALAERVAVSTGSACTSAIMEPSHVLKAMGLSDDEAYASVRFSLGKYNTVADVEHAIGAVQEAVARLREAAI